MKRCNCGSCRANEFPLITSRGVEWTTRQLLWRGKPCKYSVKPKMTNDDEIVSNDRRAIGIVGVLSTLAVLGAIIYGITLATHNVVVSNITVIIMIILALLIVFTIHFDLKRLEKESFEVERLANEALEKIREHRKRKV